jgi:preprotein translocase subunit SecG
MRSLKLAFSILHLVVCIAIIAVVLFQSGKNAGLGAISGSSDTFLARNKTKSFDARLAKATKWIAAAFIVITLILNML